MTAANWEDPPIASILIAEDEPFIVESLTFLLEREKHHVRAVGDGAVAVRVAAGSPPDLLILDAMIPTLNGFEVLKQLRANPALRRMPVLVLTAKGQESDRKQMLALGANAFMTKPFSNRALVEEVNQLLAERSGGHEGRKTS